MLNQATVTQRNRPAARSWYREPWPWLLMAGPGTVVLAGIVTTWLAVTSDDGLVAGDYYKRGIAINKTLAREERARLLGLNGQLELDSNAARLRLEARHTPGELPRRLRLTLFHATRSGLDRYLILEGGNGGWRTNGTALDLGEGRWLAVLEDEPGTWRLTARFSSPGDRKVVFGESGA